MTDGQSPATGQGGQPGGQPSSAAPPGAAPRQPQPQPEHEGPERTEGRLVLCPYCGHTQVNAIRCEACRGLFEPLSRKATQISMGPWFVRDTTNPFRPGCSYETLKRLIEVGRVHARSIIRGPTTRQFWSVARNVPGVAHLVGFCHRCQGAVRPSDPRCPSCGEPFGGMTRRNELGLAYPTPEQAERARRELEQQRQALEAGGASEAHGAAPPPRPAGAAANDDLLEQVLQTGAGASHATTTGPPADAPPTATAAATAAAPSAAAPAPPPAKAAAASQPPEPAPRRPDATPAEPSPSDGAHRSSAVVWLVVLINVGFATLAALAAWHFLF